MEYPKHLRTWPVPDPARFEVLYNWEALLLGLPIGALQRPGWTSLPGSLLASADLVSALVQYRDDGDYRAYLGRLQETPDYGAGYPYFDSMGDPPGDVIVAQNCMGNKRYPGFPLSWLYLWAYYDLWPPRDDVTPVLSTTYLSRPWSGAWYPPVREADLSYIGGYFSRKLCKITTGLWSPWRREMELALRTCLPKSRADAIPASEAVEMMVARGIPRESAIVGLGRIVHQDLSTHRAGGIVKADDGLVWAECERQVIRWDGAANG